MILMSCSFTKYILVMPDWIAAGAAILAAVIAGVAALLSWLIFSRTEDREERMWLRHATADALQELLQASFAGRGNQCSTSELPDET